MDRLRRSLRVARAAALSLLATSALALGQGASLRPAWVQDFATRARSLETLEGEERRDTELSLLAVLESRESASAEDGDYLYRAASMLVWRSGTLQDDERLRALDACCRGADLEGRVDRVFKAHYWRAAVHVEAACFDLAREDLERALTGSELDVESAAAGWFTLAEVQRQLGRQQDSLDALAALEELSPRLVERVDLPFIAEGLRASLLLDLGLPGPARGASDRELEGLERLRAEGRSVAADLHNAHMRRINLELALGSTRAAVRAIESIAEDPQMYAEQGGPQALARRREWQGKLAAVLAAGATRCAGHEDARELLAELVGQGALADGVACRASLLLAGLRLEEGDLAAADSLLARARGWFARPRPGCARSNVREDAQLAVLSARAELLRAPAERDLARVRADLEAALAARLGQWSGVPDRPGGVGLLHYDARRELLAELIAVHVAEAGAELGAARGLQAWASVDALSSLVRRSFPEGLEPRDFEALRGALVEPGRGVLVYVLAPRRSHLVAFDGERVLHAALPSYRQLEALGMEYVRHLGRAPKDLEAADFTLEQGLAQDLAELFLPPGELRDLVRSWHGVSVVGLESLNQLAFDWLRFEDGGRLGLELAVDHLPSLSFAAERAGRASEPVELSGSSDLVFVVDAKASAEVELRWPGLAPLPLGSKLEVALERAYGEGLDLREGPRARPSELRSLASVPVLQLFVHSVRAGDERPVRLVLSADPGGDGLVDCAQVEALEAARFVLLASCHSGQGPVHRGDAGGSDMGGAWLVAGAECVLLGHTELSAAAVANLSAELHGELVRGASPAEALRRARGKCSAQDPERAPFLYGPLKILGNGQRAVFVAEERGAADDPRSAWWALALVAATLAALSLGHAWTRRSRATARRRRP